MNYVNHDKFSLKIFMSSNAFFYKNSFTYIKMLKDSSAKYYQNEKEMLQKKLVKNTKVSLKKKKKKSNNMVVNDTKIDQKLKNKSWLSIEKNIK